MRITITSTENPKVKEWAKLKTKKGRDASNKFLAEGQNMFVEAKKANIISEIITTDENIDGILVTDAVMKKISDSAMPPIVIAICDLPKEREVRTRILVLRNVQDPGNVGTLIRSARSFGFTDVIVQGADPFSNKAARSSQGSIFQINVIHTKDVIPYLNGKEIVGAVVDESAKPYDHVEPKEPFALILGNEGHGLDDKIINLCNIKVYIPITFNSLNVAIAGGVLMNEYKKKLI